MHVYTSLEEQQINLDENYMCPFYVTSNGYMPHRSMLARMASSPGPNSHLYLPSTIYQSQDMLCTIPVCTTEDIQDCAARRITMYSAPNWIVPTS